ncbi:Na+/H+ antiporter subunit D [Alishewanella jeotgali]|uniref:NADH-ubiquinone oxidoreductase, chain 4L n=1 Tax=Alishewanella jeotgali KCTC 22429 TaxID=1129374 RepID=H3ZAV3_9ALTE|nr:Na+/H+ antiporter subunit D [Alishewanella jeotgali]EHR42067.1 NADH-ubiquinone oxidoreductase, chain 4L [Alishewanella jeotgali KCTC 22429]
MLSFYLYLATAALLLGVGSLGLWRGPELLRRILALNVIGAGIFMLMVSLAYRPVLYGEPADSVLHALVLTGLVVAVSATAFALALLGRLLARPQ